MSFKFFEQVGRTGRVLMWWAGATAALGLAATETPLPPASPLNNLVRQLTEKRAAQATAQAPRKEDLLKPEFRFRPSGSWVLLPDLAKQLTTNETEREAIFNLLDQGTREANRLLAAEGADNDVVAATTLFLTQLWGVVRQQEPDEAAVDALHAQLVGVLAGPEMAKLSDAEKQRYWEYCIGFPVFVLGMKEVATEPAAQADLRTIAAAGFTAVLGVRPEVVDFSPQGLVLSAAAEAELKKAQHTPAVAPVASVAAPGQGVPGVAGITYTPPPGWSRENASWATIFRATLLDVNDDGSPERGGQGHHAGSIFVLPPRAMTRDASTTFDAIWREQFAVFDLGDTIVHYRSRLKGGLVIHYMGRFFNRKVRSGNALKSYAVLYLVDLGGGRVQPVTAVVEVNSSSIGLDSFKETAAYRALSWPVAALLDSIQPAGGPAPYPAGGYFAPSELQGTWGESSGAYGGAYVNTVTGASAGVAVTSSSGSFRLGADGTYDYSFGYYSSSPQFGTSRGATKHHGRYRLDGDIVLVEPTTPLESRFTCCAVGIGTRQTPEGLRRVLVTVTAASDGGFRAPAPVPNWDSYAGTMTWYQGK